MAVVQVYFLKIKQIRKRFSYFHLKTGKITCQTDKNLCKNSGACRNILTDDIKSFKCDCKDGYGGEYCDESILKKINVNQKFLFFFEK